LAVQERCEGLNESQGWTGWFSDSERTEKPPRLRLLWRLRGIFLKPQPPLLAVMQGGESPRLQFIQAFTSGRHGKTFGITRSQRWDIKA
jgi:hypothetical protein